MSISVLGLRTNGIKDLLLSHIRERTSELAIVVGVAVVAMGDIMEAVAGNRRR